jgi:hypothetical protein
VFFLEEIRIRLPSPTKSLHDSVLLIVHLYQRHKFQIVQKFPFCHFVRIQINHGTSYNQHVLVVPTYLESLTAAGQRYHGYKEIFQGDNAGPHQDAKFLREIKDYCGKKQNWYLEPQAAQMPHMNVLNLSVFPCMSSRNTEASRGRQVVPRYSQ